MRRRQVLAAGVCSVIGIAGCLDGSSASGTADSTYPEIVVDSDPAPESAPVSIDVAVVRSFGADHPARIEISLTNDGKREFPALFGPIPPFSTLDGEWIDGTARLLLIPTDDSHKQQVIPGTATDGTWRATGDVAVNATALRVDVAPGETVSQTYDLLAAPESEGLPAGEYRFEAEDYLGRESCGFTVTVSY
ncbi:MAG: hypothetical protein ACI9YT_002034 [Halobacteriales archaeon]|jgi:hypothetical protein